MAFCSPDRNFLTGFLIRACGIDILSQPKERNRGAVGHLGDEKLMRLTGLGAEQNRKRC
ncbi:hypothetical protein MED193_05834 [Roseobacter sp. MED193]|nr:hypothetical protein MED193_05834 [Roseobacter sp. MED193]